MNRPVASGLASKAHAARLLRHAARDYALLSAPPPLSPLSLALLAALTLAGVLTAAVAVVLARSRDLRSRVFSLLAVASITLSYRGLLLYRAYGELQDPAAGGLPNASAPAPVQTAMRTQEAPLATPADTPRLNNHPAAPVVTSARTYSSFVHDERPSAAGLAAAWVPAAAARRLRLETVAPSDSSASVQMVQMDAGSPQAGVSAKDKLASMVDGMKVRLQEHKGKVAGSFRDLAKKAKDFQQEIELRPLLSMGWPNAKAPSNWDTDVRFQGGKGQPGVDSPMDMYAHQGQGTPTAAAGPSNQ